MALSLVHFYFPLPVYLEWQLTRATWSNTTGFIGHGRFLELHNVFTILTAIFPLNLFISKCTQNALKFVLLFCFLKTILQLLKYLSKGEFCHLIAGQQIHQPISLLNYPLSCRASLLTSKIVWR